MNAAHKRTTIDCIQPADVLCVRSQDPEVNYVLAILVQRLAGMLDSETEAVLVHWYVPGTLPASFRRHQSQNSLIPRSSILCLTIPKRNRSGTIIPFEIQFDFSALEKLDLVAKTDKWYIKYVKFMENASNKELDRYFPSLVIPPVEETFEEPQEIDDTEPEMKVRRSTPKRITKKIKETKKIEKEPRRKSVESKVIPKRKSVASSSSSSSSSSPSPSSSKASSSKEKAKRTKRASHPPSPRRKPVKRQRKEEVSVSSDSDSDSSSDESKDDNGDHENVRKQLSSLKNFNQKKPTNNSHDSPSGSGNGTSNGQNKGGNMWKRRADNNQSPKQDNDKSPKSKVLKILECAYCKKTGASMFLCQNCRTPYCDANCQRNDWDQCHARLCEEIARNRNLKFANEIGGQLDAQSN